MAKAFVIPLLALLAAGSADPQFFLNAPLAYPPALAAFTGPAAPAVMPAAPAVVPAVPYAGAFPYSIASYSYGQSVNVQEFPVAPIANPAPANLVSSYTSLPYPYTSLPLTALPAETYAWNYPFRR